MRIALLFILLVLVALAFWAWNTLDDISSELDPPLNGSQQESQDPRRADPKDKEEKGSNTEPETYEPKSEAFNLGDMTTAISGVVIDMRGEAVPGAKVKITLITFEVGAGELNTNAAIEIPDEERVATTLETICDGSGRFRVKPVKRPEEVWFTATDPDDKMAGQDRYLGSNRLEDLRLKIFAGSKIKGTIVDLGGAPLANIQIGVLHTDDWNPKKPIELANGDSLAMTNAKGEFELSGLQPGTLFLDIIDEEWVLEASQSLVLSEAETRTVSLQASRGLTIEGVILGTDRKPVPGAQIVIKPEAGGWRENKSGGITESGQDGRFEVIGLKPGLYTIYADGGSMKIKSGVVRPPLPSSPMRRGKLLGVAAGTGPVEVILKPE